LTHETANHCESTAEGRPFARHVPQHLVLALLDAVPLLQALPRVGALEKSVWAQLGAFRAAHAEVGVELVVDRPPGHPDVDFDLLLQVAEGTVAIGWRPYVACHGALNLGVEHS